MPEAISADDVIVISSDLNEVIEAEKYSKLSCPE